jgi:TonB family protein
MLRILTLALVALGIAAGVMGQQVYEPGNGVTLPRVVKEVRPQYTPQAKAAGIVGRVMLEGVVEPTGMVDNIRVVQSLDTKYGLDDEATKAFKQWQFEPGKKDGAPVAVRIHAELTFTLR